MLGRPRRLALLAEALFTPQDAKTAVGVLRYRPEEAVAVIDSTNAGRSAASCVGVGGSTPVVGTLAEAVAAGSDGLLIGVAPAGGRLPDPMRAVVKAALARGMDVLSGLHEFLADDPELARLARESGAEIHDVRRPPAKLAVATRRAAALDAFVVLTVGTDCNVGKMTTALELRRALANRGITAGFVATGQTGIFLADRGVAVDAVPADFIAGAVEAEVLAAAVTADWVLVEGQGSLHHPGFSGVSLGLLHGSCPRALVLCHRATRERMRVASGDGPAIRPLAEVRDDCERAAAWVRPAPVVAASIDTSALDEEAARAACASAARELRVPVTDPIRFGAGEIADALALFAGAPRAVSTEP